MPIEWSPPLRHRRGATRRLGGLDIYYDFDWGEVFRHNRAVFPKGQSLAELVQSDCPDGMRATLLLTSRHDVEPGIREVDDRYIVIVPIHDYLRQAGADAASTYYARLAGTQLTRLPTLAEAAFTRVELLSFLEEHLDHNSLSAWAGISSENRAVLQEVAGPSDVPVADLGSVLASLTALAPGQVRSLAERVREVGGEVGLRQLLNAATESRSGRAVAADVLSGRLQDRISDIRAELAEYENLVRRPGVIERDVQRFLEAQPWIIGLTYVRARPRVEIPRGELDFVLERYDGFFDILELKGPDDDIVVESASQGERPASASHYALGPSLSNALAQAHLYRSNLQSGRDLAAQYGLSDTRQPRIIIVIGRAASMSATTIEILRQLNLSLHRVSVLPFDVLGQRTEGWLQNIEGLLRGEDSD